MTGERSACKPHGSEHFYKKVPHRQGSLAHGSCFAIEEPRPLLLITIASADISRLQKKHKKLTGQAKEKEVVEEVCVWIANPV
jgi:hypothetical protein